MTQDAPLADDFGTVTRLARRLFGVPMAWVTLVDETQGTTLAPANDRPSRATSLLGESLATPDVFVVRNARNDKRFRRDPLVADRQVAFYAGAPIVAVGGRQVGTLSVADTASRGFEPKEVELLTDLAALAGEQLRMRLLSDHDEVTGLFNRRGFLGAAKYLVAISERREAPLALAYVAFENLDLLDAQFGPEIAPRLLTTTAAMLTKRFRVCDVIGRIDPALFALVLPDCTDAITATVEGVRDLWGAPQMPEGVKLNVAMVSRTKGQSLAALMRAAERRLTTTRAAQAKVAPTKDAKTKGAEVKVPAKIAV